MNKDDIKMLVDLARSEKMQSLIKKEKDPNFFVNLTTIKEINPHPNPKVENLLLAKVYDFEVIISKHSEYNKVGSKVVYFPVNSVLPPKIEQALFPPDSKIKLEKSRVKAAKIHKQVSYGLIAPWDKIKEICNLPEYPLETDLQEIINVVKHYPPPKVLNENKPVKEGTPRNKQGENEYFKKYNGCTNLKWVPNVFTEEDSVYITEKIHGSHLRVGFLPIKPKYSFWQKIKKFFGFKVVVDTHEYCYGSNNVQRQNKQSSETFYKKDVYAQAIDKYNLKQILQNHLGYVIYGEIYGPSIQKGYHYGLKNDEVQFVMFDIMEQKEDGQRWLSLQELKDFANKHDIPMVPVLYEGKWNKELAVNLASGNSVFCPSQKVIEGVVVKNSDIFSSFRNKIKIINPEYTMKEATGETTDEQEIE